MQKHFFCLALILSSTSCSVYKSQGRKNFETRVDQSIPDLAAKTIRTPEETASYLQAAQNMNAEFILADVNIFGLRLFQSTSAQGAKHWLIMDLQQNSWQIDTEFDSETEQQFLKNFHHLTYLRPE